MKIYAIDTKTNKPLINTKLQIQVRGKDSGYLTLTTDANGTFMLDDKYANQQIAGTFGGTQGQFVTATDGAKVFVTAGATTGGTTTGGQGGRERTTTGK